MLLRLLLLVVRHAAVALQFVSAVVATRGQRLDVVHVVQHFLRQRHAPANTCH